jgi:energy-converting hydrogenase B subunit D
VVAREHPRSDARSDRLPDPAGERRWSPVTVLQIFGLAAVALGAPAVVFTREPLRQAIVVGVYGLALAVLFLIVGAPDVSLSQIVISAVGLPTMILLAVAKIREHEREREADEE